MPSESSAWATSSAWCEEVEKNVDVAAAQKLADKIKPAAASTSNDFREQIAQMKKMGGIARPHRQAAARSFAGRAAQLGPAELDRAERDVRRIEGIICSMTPLERRKPELLKATRKRRIAAGAGVQVQEVNRLLNAVRADAAR